MALENHIEFLKQKHARLDRKVHEEEAHWGADDLRLRQQKVEKLRLRDQIEQLLHDARIAA